MQDVGQRSSPLDRDGVALGESASERYGVEARDILVAVGRGQLVCGQEDMVIDVALDRPGGQDASRIAQLPIRVVSSIRADVDITVNGEGRQSKAFPDRVSAATAIRCSNAQEPPRVPCKDCIALDVVEEVGTPYNVADRPLAERIRVVAADHYLGVAEDVD